MRAAIRPDVCQLIEHFIDRVRPDAAECLDYVLPPLILSLQSRYSDGELLDVLQAYNELRDALDELERTTAPSEEDDALSLHIAQETH